MNSISIIYSRLFCAEWYGPKFSVEFQGGVYCFNSLPFWIFTAIFTLANLLELRLTLKLHQKKKSITDSLSLKVFFFNYFALGFAAGAQLLQHEPALSLFIPSLTLFLFLHQLRSHIIYKQFRKNWKVSARPEAHDKLVTQGAYRFLRHPLYSIYFLQSISLWLIFPQSWTLLFVASDLIFTLRRIRIEEKLLIDHFGEEYICYKRKTKALIPFIL
jgi:protein-S-isoprenylcysteine O-methyltransferase Ste14